MVLETAFGFVVDQLVLMREQFGRYSKDEADGTAFVREPKTPVHAVTPELRNSVERTLRPLYDPLETSPGTLRPAP